MAVYVEAHGRPRVACASCSSSPASSTTPTSRNASRPPTGTWSRSTTHSPSPSRSAALGADPAPRDRLPDPTSDVDLDEPVAEVHRRTRRRVVAPSLRPLVRLLLEASAVAVGGDHLLPAGPRVGALMRWAEPPATVVAMVELPRRTGRDELAAANAWDGAGLNDRVEPLAHRLVSLPVIARRVWAILPGRHGPTVPDPVG
jgi:hypothetical protein